MTARNVKTLPVCLLILIMSVHTWAINSLFAIYENPDITLFSLNTQTGCLGFLNLRDNALLPLLSYAVFSSLFGSAGYVLCLLFHSPLVTSNAFFLEPFFAQLLGFSLGLDKLPGIMTLIGTICAVAGLAFTDSGSRARHRSQQGVTCSEKEKQDPNNVSILNQTGMLSLSYLNVSYNTGH